MSHICAHAALIPGFMRTEKERGSSETRLLALLENDRGSAAVFEGICRRRQTRQRRLQSLFMSALEKKRKKDRGNLPGLVCSQESMENSWWDVRIPSAISFYFLKVVWKRTNKCLGSRLLTGSRLKGDAGILL